ncbi:tetratricopeptide repeat-containing hybrid sensor histidine kinase/response regulator [Flavobacterium luteum]|uniref:histidine kinase n=1 Tax=Flavobacterium luteum TaxID=2026654 RepID=A0A7J5ABX8_9FLAO|nr:ATP-binding protein [Flavobacterium luteum]KAB1155074.1 response regulator [Flavobacterium luteum]
MRYYFIYFLLFSTIVSAQRQKKKAIEVDSVSYYIELSNFNVKVNNYKSSLDFAQKAIDFAVNKKDNKQEARSYAVLASLYFDLKKYDDAIESYTKSLSFYNLIAPSSEQAYSYYKLGLCYMEKGEFLKAETYFNNAQKIYSDIKIPDAIELLNLQKGIVYSAKGKYKLATPIFDQIIAKPDYLDVFKTKAEALFQLGTIELKNNRKNLALNYLNRAYELNAKDKNIEQKSKILLSLSVVHEKLLDIFKSHKYLKEHLSMKDSIAAINTKKIGTEDYANFKETERMKTIEQMDKEYKEQQKANKVAKLISTLAIALIIILSLLSISLYKNNNIKKKSNLLLKEKNAELQLAKDKAEKASKARAEFLSTVSHELRTPLNAINGITHLLLEENPKESQMNYLTSLKFSGNYLLTFINEILEINRIESSAIETENLNFNLKLLLGNIQNSLKELASINNNTFSVEIDENIPDFLIGDPTKLSQIFLNLINNALKFTKNGEVKVILNSTETNEEFTAIHFEVIDTGIGIPEEKIESVFDSFSQGSIEINRKYGGTGLGLTIVKKLVHLLGGKIKVESKVGKGSSFKFDLSFKIGTDEKIVEKVADYDESILYDKKVLLIEDNKINQMITKKMVENKRMSCEVIDNGEDAIEAVKNNKYDLVLMDVHLPGINGTIATQTIRTFDKKTLIIALTAISLNENREMLLSYGMNDVITKPFNPEEFYKIIAQNLAI